MTQANNRLNFTIFLERRENMKRTIFIGFVAMVLVILVPGGAWAKMGGLAHRLKALEAAVCALQEEIVAQ